MLSELPFFANIPVADLDRARAFYEGVLGLRPWRIDERIHEVVYEAGPARFAIYVTAGAGKSEHTIGTFLVQDMDAIVRDLRERGVQFIDYELPGLKTEEGIASFGYDRVAWFRDPDGNILALTQEFTQGEGKSRVNDAAIGPRGGNGSAWRRRYAIDLRMTARHVADWRTFT